MSNDPLAPKTARFYTDYVSRWNRSAGPLRPLLKFLATVLLLLSLSRLDLVVWQRALANLLDNAIKFTPQGGQVTLSCRQDNQQIVIRVADTGPGIPPEDLSRVLERFYRGDQSRSTPGNGLGLSLVQSIVQAHGGDISIRSEVNQGTQVALSFPLH